MSARKSHTPKRSPKKQKPRIKKQPKTRQSWRNIIERLKVSKSGKARVTMGSDGSAQVTRVRLLKLYKGINAYTLGNVVVLETTAATRKRKKAA